MDRDMQPTGTADNSSDAPRMHRTTERVWRYICKFATAYHGRVPTLRRIAAAVGLASTNTAHVHMQKLVKLGLLGKDDVGYYIEGAVVLLPPPHGGETWADIVETHLDWEDLANRLEALEARVTADAEARRKDAEMLPFITAATPLPGVN